jgi:cytochrome c nitrite reductase small subunit
VPPNWSRRPGSSAWRTRQALALVLVCALGVAMGIGGYTFRYAEGLSYFSSDPKACVNCHIMRPQFDGWQKASHHAVAVCIDCHLPHDPLPKLIAKAENGYRHSKEFTAQTFAEPIFVQQRGREILQENCVRCHGDLVAAMNWDASQHDRDGTCLHCHGGVGHGDPARLGGRLRSAEFQPGRADD